MNNHVFAGGMAISCSIELASIPMPDLQRGFEFTRRLDEEPFSGQTQHWAALTNSVSLM
jgi:hypothetical protein